MQTFQPRPIEIGGGQSPTLPQMPKLNTEFFKKYFKLGWLVALVVLAIIISAIAKQYSGRAQAVGIGSDRSSISATLSDIDIVSPLPNAVVSLPIIISGTAKSEWYDNGVFPIELYDGQNNLLASSFAIADSAPLDGGVANFSGIFESVDTEPSVSIGRVVLYKKKLQNNPADGEIASIGVRFKGVTAGGIAGGTFSGSKSTAVKTNSASTSAAKSTTVTTNTSKNTSSSTVSANSDTVTDEGTLNSGMNTGFVAGSCRDGVDNDGDKLIDWRDPACHIDNNAANMGSYSGSLSETNTQASSANTATQGTATNSSTSGTSSTATTNTLGTTSTATTVPSGTSGTSGSSSSANSYGDLVGGNGTNGSGTKPGTGTTNSGATTDCVWKDAATGQCVKLN
jgi:hypothetical protein